MNQRKRISQILFIFILCILIVYAGSHWGSVMTEDMADEMTLELSSFFMECSEKMYLTRISYLQEEGAKTPGQWITECAFQFVPLGSYVSENSHADLDVEDEETYEMILKKQAEDENMIDENGNLIENQTAKSEDENNLSKKAETIDVSEKKLSDFEYLLSHFYTVDGSTSVTTKDLNAKKLLKKDMRIDQSKDGPKILIYHTHSQEDFKDSKKGDSSTTIMGMGAYLSKLLNDTYGIETMHHTGVYDLIDGEMDRSKAYQLAEKEVKKILKENPSIEIVIDLHRDGVGKDTHLVTEINGKKTAQIMFFNGMSRTKANGDIAYLYNPYIQDNLAFSLQMQIAAAKKYPGFTRRIYLKSYRYNMHLVPKSLLIEAGAQTNTVKEMRNAMEVLADVLNECVNP